MGRLCIRLMQSLILTSASHPESAKLQDNLDGKLSRLLRDKVLKKSGRGRHSVLSLKSEFRPFYERQAEASEAKTESPREEPDAFESDSEGIIQLPDAYDTLFRDETGDGSAALSTLDVYRLHKRIDYLFKEIHLISQCDAIDFLSRLSVSTRVAENVIHSLAMTIFVKAGKTLLGLIAGEKKQKDSSLNETTRVLQGAFRETIQSGLHLFVLLLGFFKPIGEQDQTMMLRFESLLEEYCHVTVELATRGITMRLAPPHPDIADNVQRELPQLWTRLKDAYEGAPQLDGSMKADIGTNDSSVVSLYSHSYIPHRQ